jgi:hypothetical protein
MRSNRRAFFMIASSAGQSYRAAGGRVFTRPERFLTTNLAGQKLPSGATADRELWLELPIEDAAGGRLDG